MVILQMLDVSDMVKKRFSLAKLRSLTYETHLKEIMKDLLDEMYEPQLLSELLKKKDLSGYTGLDLIAKNKLHELL